LRLGRFHALRGPGLFFDYADHRHPRDHERVQGEKTLSKDTVPVEVDCRVVLEGRRSEEGGA
jgi:hypothetical protein